MTQLNTDDLILLAERESGAYGLADAGLKERLGKILDWINATGPHGDSQLRAIRQQVQRLLVARLRIALDRQRTPAIADERIERPIFVVGLPRSGTTLLHSLLAEDPEVHAPQSWHMLSPSPPPGAGQVVPERIAHTQRIIEAWMDFVPAQRQMHPYIDKGAHQLMEDEEIFCLDFRNVYPYHYYHVPTADFGVRLGADAAGAFQFHREFLQHHQWNTPRRRWVCKSPSAQGFLDVLFDTYPDALCVWAHRPMGDIYASNVALRAAIFDTISGRPNDWNSRSMAIAEGMKQGIDAMLAQDLVDDPRVMHLPFRDLTADPLGTVRRIYERAGLGVGKAFAGAIERWLRDPENDAARYGRYPYSYEAFGLSREWIEDLFADYSKRFGLD
ncbi:MAG: sulfotransferase [Novosphingobium sp.]